MSKTYDNAGRMDSDALTIAGQTYTTGYAHDVRNQLTQLTYPSGKRKGTERERKRKGTQLID